MIFSCPVCGKRQSIPSPVLRTIRTAGIGVKCSGCVHLINPWLLRSEKQGATDDQKRSREQEKQAAKRYGGQRVPASGAMADSKGDVRDKGRLMVECKFTRAKSYNLKVMDLMKLEKEAGGEIPVFEVEFQSVHPHRRYVIVPAWHYEHLNDLLKGRS